MADGQTNRQGFRPIYTVKGLSSGKSLYAKATVFDLVLPSVAAGVEVTKKQLSHMGNGGFCLGCKPCHYPNCGFGNCL